MASHKIQKSLKPRGNGILNRKNTICTLSRKPVWPTGWPSPYCLYTVQCLLSHQQGENKYPSLAYVSCKLIDTFWQTYRPPENANSWRWERLSGYVNITDLPFHIIGEDLTFGHINSVPGQSQLQLVQSGISVNWGRQTILYSAYMYTAKIVCKDHIRHPWSLYTGDGPYIKVLFMYRLNDMVNKLWESPNSLLINRWSFKQVRPHMCNKWFRC